MTNKILSLASQREADRRPALGLKVSKKVRPLQAEAVPFEERITAAVGRGKEIRRRKEEAAQRRGAFSQTLISSVWQEANSQAHKGHPCAFTGKDIIILKRHVTAIHKGGVDAMGYLRWVVANWKKVMAAKFAWMRADKPMYPAVRFMVKFKDEFQAAYADRETVEKLATMTTRDRIVAKRVAAGMDEEAAERDVEEAKPQPKKIATVSKPDELGERVRRAAAKVRVRVRPRNTEGSFGEWKD